MPDNIPAAAKGEFVDNTKKGSKGLTYKLVGTTLQALSVQLDEGESIYSEAGKMSWMTSNITFTTHGQGCSQMFSRLFTSENLFVNKFTSKSGTGIVTFTTEQTGKIIPLEMKNTDPAIIFQKGSYLCSEENIKRSIAFTKKFGAGLFGGKGFILQKLEGEGRAYLVADGEVVEYNLEEGQSIYVDQGNLVAYESTVDFDIETVSGPFNWLFGGEGIFLGVMKGPGKVWLQTRKTDPLRNLRMQSYNNGFSKNPIGALIGIIMTFGFIFACILINIIANTGN